MKLFKIMYAAVGIIFAAGSIVTGEYGLSEVSREIYRTAVSLDKDMQKLDFPGFSLADYKVRFYNGNCDYVVEAGQEKAKKEDAVMDTFVGTSMEVDGEYQVLLPAYEKFSDMFDMLNAVDTVSHGAGDGTISFTKGSYSENAHAAVMWHEAFHVWQMEKWEKEIDELIEQAYAQNDAETEDIEEIIVKEADTKPEAVSAFEEEIRLLKEAYHAPDNEKKEWVKKALEVSENRKKQLSDSASAMEFYFENLEGSAMYVEGQAYRFLEGDAAWEEHYMGEFQYENGRGKYYHLGMLKCVLLDEMMEGWQKKFNMNCGLDELLQACTRYAVKEGK